MKLAFMGTPDFAVPALEALAAADAEISLVVTQPDRPRGRGHRMMPTPVKEAAQRLGIRVTQPTDIRQSDFAREIAEIEPDLIVVAAYGKILPKGLLTLPRCGCVNLHASLLPKYRGAAPIHRAIEAGETVTGVTLMRMSEGLDEGDILDTRELEIGDSDTGELTRRLAILGAELISGDLPYLLSMALVAVPQKAEDATYAPMVSKAEAHIDFANDAERVLCKIRAMNPLPGAYAFLDGEKLRIKKARLEAALASDDLPAGTVAWADDSGISVTARQGNIIIEVLQLPGGKAMKVSDFLRGHSLAKGTLLE